MATKIDLLDLDDWLQNQQENTKDTPYQINIVGITDDNKHSIRNTLINNRNKYVDLSSTVLPSVVRDIYHLFAGCITLVKAPNLQNLSGEPIGMWETFKDCISLVEAPVIPDNVVQMIGCFRNCTSLISVPNIPNTGDLGECFYNCTSLKYIEVFKFNLEECYEYAHNCFYNCNSLVYIGVKSDLAESDWHLWRLKFGATTVEGKVYDRNGNAINIPQTSITKSSLKLPIKTDELWFPDMTDSDFDTDAKIDALIEKVIQFRYTYHINAVIEPDKKTFVLQADDPDNFITNLPIIPPRAVDRVESGNMNPVTSNAVANYKPVASSVELNANNIIKFKKTSLNGYRIQDVQTNALYVEGREGDSGDSGGVVITNDGVTAFGAGDTDGVFRVVNEDNPTGGAVFKVMKDGTVYGGTYNGKATQASRVLIEGSTWDGHFWWSGQGGQPTWLWGSNDGVNMYLWNPSNFSVAYASRAGSSGGGTLYDSYGAGIPLGEYSYMINNGLLIFVAWITSPTIYPFNLPCAIVDRYWSGSIQVEQSTNPRTKGVTTGQTQCGIIIGGVA